MCPSETPPVPPEGGDHEGVIDAMTTLGLRLVKACQHAHLEQGVSINDLIWMLHGIMGQVLSWSFRR
jgi:hypothetical protein